MKFKIKYNRCQDMTLNDFINSEYENYCLEADEKLSKGARELKYAWLLIIERLQTYNLLKGVKE
mgnify:CR=1 FL=1